MGSTFLFHRLWIICVQSKDRTQIYREFPDYISTVHARYMFWNYNDDTELVELYMRKIAYI